MRKNLKPGDLCLVSHNTYNIHGFVQTYNYAIILSISDFTKLKDRNSFKFVKYTCLVDNKIEKYSYKKIKLID